MNIAPICFAHVNFIKRIKLSASEMLKSLFKVFVELKRPLLVEKGVGKSYKKLR